MTDTYAYDAFGTLRSRTGTTANEFTFTGEQTDPAGLQYLRARYYDPSIGRFWTRDPFSGTIADPMSLNRYVYGSNNPVMVDDPWGLCSKWPPNKWGDCPHKAAEKAVGVVQGAGRRVVEVVKDLGATLAGCDWRRMTGGLVLSAAGTGLVAIGVGAGAIVVGSKGAAAPSTGGTSLLLTLHSVSVAGAVAGVGFIAITQGIDVMTDACPSKE